MRNWFNRNLFDAEMSKDADGPYRLTKIEVEKVVTYRVRDWNIDDSFLSLRFFPFPFPFFRILFGLFVKH